MTDRCSICGDGLCPEPGICPERLRDARSAAAGMPVYTRVVMILIVAAVVAIALLFR